MRSVLLTDLCSVEVSRSVVVPRLRPPPPSAKIPSCPPNRVVLALAQVPFIVGDIEGNRDRLLAARAEAQAFDADLVMTPEIFLAGSAPEGQELNAVRISASTRWSTSRRRPD